MDLFSGREFADLLVRLASIRGENWLRLVLMNPDTRDEDLAELAARC